MAERNLGTMRIDLVALTGKFTENMRSASGSLDRFGVAATAVASHARGAFARIGAAVSGLRAAVLSVQGVVTGAAVGYGLFRIARSFHSAAEAVDDLGKRSKVLGLSVEQLSALRLAAAEAGVDFETLSKLVGKASKNIAEFASSGGGKGADALRRLGVDIRTAEGSLLPIGEVLPRVARALQSVASESERIRLAEGIFGREGGQQFLLWLGDAGDFMGDLAAQTERARRLGVLFTREQADRLKTYADAVGRVGEAMLGLRVRLMSELAPTLERMSDELAEFIGRSSRLLANLASVVRAGFLGQAVFRGEGREVNQAFRAVRHWIDQVLRVAWAEVSTRVRYFALRTTIFLREVVLDVAGEIGRVLLGAADGVGGVIGEALASIGRFVGDAVAGFAERLGSAGGAAAERLADHWRKAGLALEGYAESLAEERAAQRAMLWDATRRINELGEKYRELRGEAGEAGEVWEATAAHISTANIALRDLAAGAREGILNLRDQVEDFAALGRDLTESTIRMFSSDLASALASGQASFRTFGQTAIDILGKVGEAAAQMVLEFLIARAVVGGLGPVLAPASSRVAPNLAGPAVATYARHGGVFGFAAGGIAAGVLPPGPVAFGFSRHVGVASEHANREVAIAPLRRIGGELGVAATGGDVTVQIIDQRSSGARPEVTQGRGADGRKAVRVMIRDAVNSMIGAGELDRAMRGAYGISRRGS